MTVLVTADIHLSDNPRDAYRHAFQKRLRSVVRKNKIDTTIILGDLTESKDEHGAWLVNRLVEHMDRLAALCDVVIVRGNHDYLSPDHPYFEFLERIEGITWINAPTDNKVAQVPGLGALGRVLFLPHTHDHAKDWEGLRIGLRYDWVFTHNTFDDVYVGHGQRLKGIPLGPVTGARVVSGDIHIPQTLGPVTYVGAPYRVDFGDEYEPRMLQIDDKETMTSIKCDGPQKRLVQVATVKDLDDVEGIHKGDILSIKIDLPPDKYGEWPSIQQAVREWGDGEGFTIHSVRPVKPDQLPERGKPREVRMKRTDDQLLKDYTKRHGVGDRMTKTGRFLMNKAG